MPTIASSAGETKQSGALARLHGPCNPWVLARLVPAKPAPACICRDPGGGASRGDDLVGEPPYKAQRGRSLPRHAAADCHCPGRDLLSAGAKRDRANSAADEHLAGLDRSRRGVAAKDGM